MMINEHDRKAVIRNLIQQHGEPQQERIVRGVHQVALRWRKEDGSPDVFRQFCIEHFVSNPAKLTILFERFLKNLESLYGNLHRVYKDFNWQLHVDTGEMLPVDNLFAAWDVFAHVTDDFFQTKLAFLVLLNFSLASLAEKTKQGRGWHRKRWAELRLAEQFADRVPAAVNLYRTTAYTQAEKYIYSYNIFMHNIIDKNGQRLFPEGLRLISHWDLRDEIKAQYAHQDGLPRQEVIYLMMQRIIHQEIPRQVINNPQVDWEPLSNRVFMHGTQKPMPSEAEETRRYETLLNIFRAEQMLDSHTPDTPTLIARRFERDREIPETEVETLLQTILRNPLLKNIAGLIEKRLKRPLRPFDIWYTGFKDGSGYPEEELDSIVRERYPTLAAFQSGLPKLLMTLGFSREKAEYLSQYIQVDPARGAGHAMGAKMRGDRAHLRTRVPAGGMNYKGFNTAMHELGHSVEQVFSMNEIDYYTLEGVPNTAFTEAFAFVFQSRDLDVLGLTNRTPENEAWLVLHNLWQTMEIAGVSLLDMRIWRWMYEHPDTDAAGVKETTIALAKQIWNEFFAPLFGITDQVILAIYSHILYCGMYIPDYALGHIISFQIEDYLKHTDFAREMERMCKLGRLAPGVWMEQALGSSVSAKPLLTAAEKALEVVSADSL